MSDPVIWKRLVIVAAILLLVANTAVWADRSLADTDAFVDAAMGELEREDTRAAIAGQIVFALIGNQPLLYETTREPVERAVTILLGTPGFRTLLTRIATALHELSISDGRVTVTVGPTFLIPIIAAIATTIGPDGILDIREQQLEIEIFRRDETPSLETIIDLLQIAGPICGIAGVALLALSVAVSHDRSRALYRVALALVGVVAATLLLIPPLRRLYLASFDSDLARAITAEVLGVFTNQLIIQSLLLLIPAALIAVAGAGVRDSGLGNRR